MFLGFMLGGRSSRSTLLFWCPSSVALYLRDLHGSAFRLPTAWSIHAFNCPHSALDLWERLKNIPSRGFVTWLNRHLFPDCTQWRIPWLAEQVMWLHSMLPLHSFKVGVYMAWCSECCSVEGCREVVFCRLQCCVKMRSLQKWAWDGLVTSLLSWVFWWL